MHEDELKSSNNDVDDFLDQLDPSTATPRKTMLKNKPYLVTFNESVWVSR